MFVNWTGNSPCSVGTRATNSSCAFVLQANTTVTPNYRAADRDELNKAGNGPGHHRRHRHRLAGGGELRPRAGHHSVLRRQAGDADRRAGGRLALHGFAGACVSTSSPCTFSPVGNNQTITSTFTLRQFVITAANVPGGHVSNPGSLVDDISCGALSSDCTATVDYNYPVTSRPSPTRSTCS